MSEQTNYTIHHFVDGYPLIELKEAATRSRVVVCPERGAIVIHCELNGQELLYLDRDTFLNPQANIRGGIPVLFPICGQLVGGQYEWKGSTYQMKNHGVARVKPWEVIQSGTDNGAYVTLTLHSDEETLASFPFAFELQFTYRLKDGKLSIEQQYTNQSGEQMPMVAGFHPYFATDSKNLAYSSDATKLLDYNDNVEKPFNGTFDLNGLVESVALLDSKRPEIAFPLKSSGGRVHLSYSETFRYAVLWSVEGKPFVCVEPWTALNEALNDKKGLLLVEPGQALQLQMTIAYEA
ncbi:galactose mutarotase-like enzyme [Paenibacillus cellulosilyticus]|uniref:Galactose mutarotase-like enzyme n=1 Tax=Paenibacillus cellulosilyticus TaxID=375489 RepID=A0A2V2YUY2_9BACL|nr:aldose epimerase [Paenibacillus cellulosilyticus]PWW02832.1 galactose mutarotase-like enzyme [Paenibacillus cellulosilyticus]QKS45751.1 aldose epimerase [Paenibacillus cellulosilyticus]